MQTFVRTRLALILVVLLAASTPTLAQRGDDSKRLSKNGKTQATIEGVEVTVEYGRPSVKNRTIWGGLVPYDRIWRTGADEATTLSLEADALVEGQALAAGTYSLFTIPGESEWTVVFNKVADQWGAFNYDEAQDALRVTVEPAEAEFVETLEFQTDESNLVLRWAELALPIEFAPAE